MQSLENDWLIPPTGRSQWLSVCPTWMIPTQKTPIIQHGRKAPYGPHSHQSHRQSDPETEAETEPHLQAILEKQWEGQGAWALWHLNDCFLAAGLNTDWEVSSLGSAATREAMYRGPRTPFHLAWNILQYPKNKKPWTIFLLENWMGKSIAIVIWNNSWA